MEEFYATANTRTSFTIGLRANQSGHLQMSGAARQGSWANRVAAPVERHLTRV